MHRLVVVKTVTVDPVAPATTTDVKSKSGAYAHLSGYDLMGRAPTCLPSIQKVYPSFRVQPGENWLGISVEPSTPDDQDVQSSGHIRASLLLKASHIIN
jgi:hypothetical protein